MAFVRPSFPPAAWILRRRIGRTREMACDEAVTRMLMPAHVYARSMLSIAAAAASLPRPSHMLGAFDGDALEARVRRLVERPSADRKHERLALAGAFRGDEETLEQAKAAIEVTGFGALP
jgi:beta-lactamase regulating signal transducer with metallopeptidase domain